MEVFLVVCLFWELLSQSMHAGAAETGEAGVYEIIGQMPQKPDSGLAHRSE
jgi:hypothetical protein